MSETVSYRGLVWVRRLVGPIVVWHLWPFLHDAWRGHIYRDRFYEPYASWYPELPRAVYAGLLWLGAAAAIAMVTDLRPRLTTKVAFGVVAYNLFLSTTHYHHNRAYLVIVLGILAFTPWNRRAGAGDGDGDGERGPAWPVFLLRFECAAVYGASGLSKLADPDWFSGLVTWGRVVQVRDRVEASVLPHWAVDVLANRSFHTVAAKVIIATELFIAIGLWFRKTRYAAVAVAVVFHIAIQLSASVEVFSALGIAVLAVWVVPSRLRPDGGRAGGGDDVDGMGRTGDRLGEDVVDIAAE